MQEKLKIALSALPPIFFLVVFYFSLPSPIFHDPTSTILYAENNELLGARIAKDGQWRFPSIDSVPYKFEKSIIYFEDEYFYRHPGFNPISIIKAAIHNLTTGGKRGGSTITMQTIRLSRKGQSRTIGEKIIELYLAIRVELSYSKDEILKLYSSNAPFGGNVVGLEAACWRYYGRPPEALSWGEAATLAVLPNAPALIYPGKNQDKLLKKRNLLLKKLWENEIIDSLTYRAGSEEPLPQKPFPLPQFAPHLIDKAIKDGKEGKRIYSSLNIRLQKHLNKTVKRHHNILKHNHINNIASLVIDVKSGKIKGYVGNTTDPNFEFANAVNMIEAERSTGSILKPFLYASMLSDGDLLPNTLVDDIPTYISGYVPKNYDLSYSGVVPAKMALYRSLNIPAVKMLQEYRIEKFIDVLNHVGLSTIDKSADYYGLTLVLGGAEAKLQELCNAYAGMSRQLQTYTENSSLYLQQGYLPSSYLRDTTLNDQKLSGSDRISASAIWFTHKAMVEVNRPPNEEGWENFSSSKQVAWKTGTSFGNRDAWAIGFNSDYVVGVWVGNADGEGRPGLTGVSSAAPLLFDIFKLLPPVESGFTQPYDDMELIEVCKKSGHRALEICPKDTVWINKAGLKTKACPYHKLIHLDKTETYRVTSDCELVSEMVHRPWFVLPPVQAWYYKIKNPTYRNIPKLREDCQLQENSIMDFISPAPNSKIFIPKNLSEQEGKLVIELAHKNRGTKVFWHLNNEYLQQTDLEHKIEISPGDGFHTITAVDEDGNEATISFEILSRRE